MNKIVLNGGINVLEKFNEDAMITVSEDSVLNAINLQGDLNLDIKISNNKTFTLNIFDYVTVKNINLLVECDDEAKFNLNVSFINSGSYNLNVKNNLYGSNIISNVNVRGINESGANTTILMDGTVAGETVGNVLNEYAKIINKSDKSSVLIPNLIVNTNDVIANHGVSIGNINDDELFYLKSKGIDKYSARKLLEEGFILSIMDEDIKTQIKNILIGR